MIDAIICDWNRTIFEDRYEEVFFEDLFKKVMLEAIKGLNIVKIWSMLQAQNRCKRLSHRLEIDSKYEYAAEIIAILNKNVINGIHISFLQEYTDIYVNHATNRLDRRILDPLRTIKSSKNIRLGVISSGYAAGIEQILKRAGYIFDFVKANDFEINSGIITKFKLNIFNNKYETLKSLLDEYGIDCRNVVYIGDDWQDEDCLGKVGYPVVPFLAKDRYRKYFFEKLNAFVPKDKKEFEVYLQSAIGR